jgi:hypothetical protein
MVRLRRAFVVVVVGGAMTMGVRMPAAQQPRVADAVVSTGDAVPLSTPVTSFTTIDAVRRTLSAAHVPFGIEGPAQGEPPVVDLAQPRVDVADLRGLSVAAALDAIERLDRSVRWSEQDGVIDVRMTPGATWIDRELPEFAVTNASKTTALDALAAAIDPARGGRVAPTFPLAGRGVVIHPPNWTPPAPIMISTTHERGSVLEGLNALAREGHTSWRITYDGASLDANDASIAFGSSLFDSVVSASPTAGAERARGYTISVDVGVGLEQSVLNYARGAHLSVGIEALPAATSRVPTPTVAVLSLDRRRPREALEQLLAYDSRYALSEEHGMFHLRLRSGTTVAALDKTVLNFSATNRPFMAVFNQVLGRGPAATARGSVSPADAVFEAPLSVTADRSTVRELLDTICRDIGASWMVRTLERPASLPASSRWLDMVEVSISAPNQTLTTMLSWR